MKIALVNATNMNQFYEGWTDYIIAENSLLKSEQIISTAVSNNENEGISTLSLNDLETIKIIVEEDS